MAIDRDRASDLGLSVRAIAETLRILLGGEDLSTFKLDGETYDVMAQLGRGERNDPRDLLELFVRNPRGELISLSGVVKVRETVAPREINHYDRARNVRFTVLAGAHAQGDAIEQVSEIARSLLPPEGGYAVRVAGESEDFIESGNALTFAYVLAIVIVYLVLAAQFESFVHPFTILVAVALSFTGALLDSPGVDRLHSWRRRTWSARSTSTRKIGLVMLIGLVTKNSILIVEFANQLRERGRTLADATLEASRVRFRPILMTARRDDGRHPADRARPGRRRRLARAARHRRARRHVLLDRADLLRRARHLLRDRARARAARRTRTAPHAAAVPVAGGR